MTDHETESAECGYTVTPGHLYCRQCGGGGHDVENDRTCRNCLGKGEHPKNTALEGETP